MREPLTDREKEIREYLLQRHYKELDHVTKLNDAGDFAGEYERGQLAEVTEILGKVLDILGG